MFVSTDWIKDFVELPDIDSSELGSRFTMATCEVEEVKTHGEFLKGITIAQIESIKKHPEADKLNLVTVKLSDTESKEVVCGANNVEIGKKVPYAPLGTTFPNGLTLEPKKIRGVLSEGMLCGETELELGDDDSGLFIQPDDAPVGVSIADYFEIKTDVVLDIDNKSITHRPDLWGHYGMAREFSLVFDKDLNNKFNKEWEDNLLTKLNDKTSPIIPEIQGETCCLAYNGLSVDNIKVESSPQWMQQRLSVCGIRPINSIVDISNYVMLELGIPLHIFDRDLIKGQKIIIRAAGENCTVKTLDDIDRELLPTDTVVADAEEALVVAGIMGGASSGVSEKTTKIFLEVANWVDAEVRKTSTRIGLRTDSSQRYEKSLDSQLLKKVMLRTLELILELNPDAEVIGQIQTSGKETGQYKELSYDVSLNKINKVLGKDIEADTVINILEKLEFKITRNGDILTVGVPSFRATKDIDCDAAIIEEIGRIIGYDNITPVSPQKVILPISLNAKKKLHRKIEDFLVLNGSALQVLTNPMVGEALLKKADWHTLNEELVLVNALSKDHDRMRPSMIPSILESSALNSKTFDKFSLFELGRSYLPDSKNFSTDNDQVIIALYDRSASRYLELVNIVEKLGNYLNLSAQITAANTKFPSLVVDREWKGLHPNENLDIKVMGKNCGTITTIHPTVLKSFKIKGNLAVAVLDLNSFQDRELKDKVAYKPLPKFPSSTFDCSVIADPKEPVATIVDLFKKAKISNMESIKVVDVFTLDNDKKSVTLRATFIDPEKTLSHEFLEEAKNNIVKTLDKAGFPLKA